ncbi:molybdopterin molybdotransferase MoeA [Palleronia sp. KMU-117]|uniref:molybdopterin molybdotransferase MoeA n=1 Tax=Palleronia sp. KMU-117 TaxID=3434108 RepID=UPI003D754D8C
MITVDEALARVLALARPPEEERVPLRAAANRVLLGTVAAARAQPPFAASAMDGYAVAADAPAPGDRFRVIGAAAAGAAFAGRVGPGEALRIFTGAPVPEGATRVILQEDVEVAGDVITVKAGLDAGRNIRPAGADFAAGATLSGPRRLRPVDLARLAAMNLPEVPVARRPEVALIATGDELVMPGEVPRDDQIVASNAFALAAMVEAEGGVARLLPIARDTDWALRAAFDMARGADLIVTIGGASVGDHDLVGKVAGDMGLERAFHKIAMRPGKPLMAGHLLGAALLGLPGNPVSAIVCGHLFLLPLLRALQGLPAGPAPRHRAPLAAPVGPNGPREHYMRATRGPEGLIPAASQDSSLLSVLSEADALIVRPVGDGPRGVGEIVDYLPI